MMHLGIDLGASTVKLAWMDSGRLQKTWISRHNGTLLPVLIQGLEEIGFASGRAAIAVTGSNCQFLPDIWPELFRLGDIPAVVEGVRFLQPEAASVMEIGSQGARFITGLDEAVPEFSVNEHCAGGTGSFFEDQMSRLGLKIEDYSRLTEQARSVPRLSGRCAVFAKTDIIHRQQEGVPTPDILLGLCYAMIRNYKATIVRNLPVKRPVVFSGGVTQNSGVIRAIREIFCLEENELIVPNMARFTGAIGAAVKAEGNLDCSAFLNALKQKHQQGHPLNCLPALRLAPGTKNQDPEATGVIPADGCALGIDIGSTSTNLVLVGRDGTLADFQYLRTAGDPESAVRKGLASIRDRFGAVKFLSVGVTGSGRERMGRLLGADAVRDEITAQAKAAAHWVPEADTVFEIGGQDSKYILIQNGEVADFQMNKICAAGTGSFVEEQAARMGIPIGDFGLLALTSEAPVDLGERCTVFIETAITSAASQGASPADIAAGLCHSIIQNYLHKVVGSKPVGRHIVLQGGVAYNPGIVAAFQCAYGERIHVSPCFSISGAYGAALLALEAVSTGGELRESTFRGFDFPDEDSRQVHISEEIKRNIRFYEKPRELLLQSYAPAVDPRKKTVGIPMVLIMHKFFPLANAFFKGLGFNVVLSGYSNEDTIRLSQQYAQGETCYPVKLIYGHMVQLIEKGVDYIFLPAIHTMAHAHSEAAYSYGCVYMQTAARSIATALKIEDKGIHLLNPLFDLDFGKKAMVFAMLGVGKELGFSRPRCMKALLNGAMAVRRFDAQVEELGQQLLQTLKPEDKVMVLITRNYGINDPVLNMGIPERLLERGHKVITLPHLPGHGINIGADYPNMYWAFGEHILSGAKLIAHHPNLYAVYLTNHGCGPDSLLSHLFRQEMGDKPYLQIEVDEHFSPVGVITRIEAFLNSLSHRPSAALPEGFDIRAVAVNPAAIDLKPKKNVPLYIPDIGYYTAGIAAYFREACGVETRSMPKLDSRILALGRAETNTKEYLPFPALLGGIFDTLKDTQQAQFLIPSNQGAEADGQYARVIRAILDRQKLDGIGIVAPILETLPQTAADLDALFRGLAMGDIVYAAPAPVREELAWRHGMLKSWDELSSFAGAVGAEPVNGRTLAAVGTPLCLTSLNDGVLATLDKEGEQVLRAPLTEYLWFLLFESSKEPGTKKMLRSLHDKLNRVFTLLGERSTFTSSYEDLASIANKHMPNVSGGNGRYRYAKAVWMGGRFNAVLTLAPRYENTAVVLDMREQREACPAPLFQISLDGDWDETSWSRLRSFLYYLNGDA